MKEKINYSYQVGGIGAATREAARIIQRSFRETNEWHERATGEVKPVPRIIQKLTKERIVR